MPLNPQLIEKIAKAINAAEVPSHGSHLMACFADGLALESWAKAACKTTLDEVVTWIQQNVSHTHARNFARQWGIEWDLHHSADKEAV